MKRLLIATAAISLLAAPAFAQNWNNHDDHHGNTMMMRHDDHHDNNAMMMMRHDNHRDHRNEWHKGSRLDRNDWNRGARVNDWQRHHLSRPPRGYEWRRVDDNYVLAAAATGIIASILLANN